MSDRDLESAVATLRQLDLVDRFERIADAYGPVKTSRDAKLDALIEMRLVKYTRGKAELTQWGWSVSTRIAAKASAKTIAARGPGWWRS